MGIVDTNHAKLTITTDSQSSTKWSTKRQRWVLLDNENCAGTPCTNRKPIEKTANQKRQPGHLGGGDHSLFR